MKYFIYVLFLAFSISSSLSADPTKNTSSVEGLRIWTNNKKKNITASLVKITQVKADQKKNTTARTDVTFKLKTGKKIILSRVY